MHDHTCSFSSLPQSELSSGWLVTWQSAVDRCRDLSPGAQLLAHRCLAPIFSRYGLEIFRARRNMAEIIGRNVRTVTRYVRELVDAGFVAIVQRPHGGVNTFTARVPLSRAVSRGVDTGDHQSSCSTRNKDEDPPTPPPGGRDSLFFVSNFREMSSYEDVNTCSYDARAPKAGHTTGRPDPSSAVSGDLTAPDSWPEREKVPEEARMPKGEALEGCKALGLSDRLALHLAASYTAETAGRAQYPQSYARRLALELEARTSGPGIKRKRRRRPGRGKRPKRPGRSAVDRLNASLALLRSGTPAPAPPPEEVAAQKAEWSELLRQAGLGGES